MQRVFSAFSVHRLRLAAFGLATALTAVLACATALGGCETVLAEAAPSASQAPQVRVLLLRGVREVRITATKPPVLDGEGVGGAVWLSLPNVPVSISIDDSGWRIGDRAFARGPLRLTPEREGSLSINGKRYRGSLRLVPSQGEADQFDVINDLDVESYLMGVLPKELPAWWRPETYEAQAVVARTYAIWELKTVGASRGHFDLFDDDKSQVYGGMNAETDKSRRAVQNTRGQVVVHETPQGPRIFKAYFHSTSGGVTLGVESAFKESPIQALSSQSLGDGSKASRYNEWPPITLTKEELTRRVVKWGERRNHPVKNIVKIDRLEIAACNEFGRPTRFELVDTRGNRYSLIPEEIRWAINTDAAKGTTVFSGFFEPINNHTNIVISNGRGWGHGVGMCQFTAEHWASQGKNYIQIVTLSYPGTAVVRAY